MSVTMKLVTVPTVAAFNTPYPEDDRQPPKSYKSTEAIDKWRTGDRKKWTDERAEQCGDSPMSARILMAGFVEPDGKVTIFRAPTEGQEAQLLRDTWGMLEKHSGQIATWNGTMDCRTLIARSVLHGVENPVGASTTRNWYGYNSLAHQDVKFWLTQDKHAKESLAGWSEAFGLPHRPAELDAATIWTHAQAGEHEIIANGLHADLLALHSIAERTAPFQAPVSWQTKNHAEATAATALANLTPPRVGAEPPMAAPATAMVTPAPAAAPAAVDF
jgi:hypothetical protein